jgi:hypothetical protein
MMRLIHVAPRLVVARCRPEYLPQVLGMFILVEALTACGFIKLLAGAGVSVIGKSTFRGTLVSGCTYPYDLALRPSRVSSLHMV